MKVNIEDKEIRVIGDFVGKERHLSIYCNTKDSKDIYSISIIKDGLDIGILTITMDKDNIITCNPTMSIGKKLLL